MKPRVLTARRMAAVTLGTTLAGGGLLHMFVHNNAGVHDWAAIVAIVLGSGLAFNEEVANLIRAWRAKSS